MRRCRGDEHGGHGAKRGKVADSADRGKAFHDPPTGRGTFTSCSSLSQAPLPPGRFPGLRRWFRPLCKVPLALGLPPSQRISHWAVSVDLSGPELCGDRDGVSFPSASLECHSDGTLYVWRNGSCLCGFNKNMLYFPHISPGCPPISPRRANS